MPCPRWGLRQSRGAPLSSLRSSATTKARMRQVRSHNVTDDSGSPEGCSQPSSPPLCGGVMTRRVARLAQQRDQQCGLIEIVATTVQERSQSAFFEPVGRAVVDVGVNVNVNQIDVVLERAGQLGDRGGRGDPRLRDESRAGGPCGRGQPQAEQRDAQQMVAVALSTRANRAIARPMAGARPGGVLRCCGSGGTSLGTCMPWLRARCWGRPHAPRVCLDGSWPRSWLAV